MFDCWLQEQEENNQPKIITACKAAAEKAYKLLGTPAPKQKSLQKNYFYHSLYILNQVAQI